MTSDKDILFVDINEPDLEKREIDIDEKEDISAIMNIYSTDT